MAQRNAPSLTLLLLIFTPQFSVARDRIRFSLLFHDEGWEVAANGHRDAKNRS